MELRQNKTVWDSNLKLLSKAEVIIRRAEKNWIFTINIVIAEHHFAILQAGYPRFSTNIIPA